MKNADYQRAVARRDRNLAITKSPEAKGHTLLAQHLALDSNYSAADVRAILAGASSGRLPAPGITAAPMVRSEPLGRATGSPHSIDVAGIYRRRAAAMAGAPPVSWEDTSGGRSATPALHDVYSRRAAAMGASQGQPGVVHGPAEADILPAA